MYDNKDTLLFMMKGGSLIGVIIVKKDKKINGTTTSSFGVGKRENHNSSLFYSRFDPPILDNDDTVQFSNPEDKLIRGDSRFMREIKDNSVALVVTSPPYFVGKEYEKAVGSGLVPESYITYLLMLEDVFRECRRVLEPGGRIAINVANLGRKPYRSLSSDVIHILQDKLKLLLRGEIIWKKADGAGGSCAWGSFKSAQNPVLRDITERIIIASKGRFDRAKSSFDRKANKLPYRDTITSDEFLEATLDLWEIASERASRVNHPAPFPVELPQRLIDLYTFENDLVLDPFVGSGSSLIAANRTGRRFIGYDLDENYLAIAKARSLKECNAMVSIEKDKIQKQSVTKIAASLLHSSGFLDIRKNVIIPKSGLKLSYSAKNIHGETLYFDIVGRYTNTKNGFSRSSEAHAAISRAYLAKTFNLNPLVCLTTYIPDNSAQQASVIFKACSDLYLNVIDLLDEQGKFKLQMYAKEKVLPEQSLRSKK